MSGGSSRNKNSLCCRRVRYYPRFGALFTNRARLARGTAQGLVDFSRTVLAAGRICAREDTLGEAPAMRLVRPWSTWREKRPKPWQVWKIDADFTRFTVSFGADFLNFSSFSGADFLEYSYFCVVYRK